MKLIRTIAGVGALTVIATAGAWQGKVDLEHLRRQEGARLCENVLKATPEQMERWNIADGLRPNREFSFDDYCGAQCRPNSISWSACVDGCYSCVEAIQADARADSTDEDDRAQVEAAQE